MGVFKDIICECLCHHDYAIKMMGCFLREISRMIVLGGGALEETARDNYYSLLIRENK